MSKIKISNEGELQKYAVKALRGVGCLVYKFSSPSKRGVPDLIVVTPDGKTIFIELKHPYGTGRLSRLQELEIESLRLNNAIVYVFNRKEEIDNLVLTVECETHA